MNRQRKLPFRYAYAIYLLLILVASIIPSAGVGKIEMNLFTLRIDYPLHALAFIPIPIFAFLGNGLNCTSFQWNVMLTLATILALGAEFIQLLVPSRTFNPFDLLCNLLGLSIGILIARIWCRINTRKHSITI